jgi:hypothetical protein
MSSTTLTLQEVRERRAGEAGKNNPLALPDHLGPLQRLELVKQDPQAMNIISQRVMDGESLKQIAESWGLPVRPFCKWVTDDPNHALEYDAALKIRADEYYHETIMIADACEDKDDVPAARAKMDARHKFAGKLDRERFGDENQGKGAGNSIIINIQSLAPQQPIIIQAETEKIEADSGQII